MDVKNLWLAQVSLCYWDRDGHRPDKTESLSVLVLAETREEATEKVGKKYTRDHRRYGNDNLCIVDHVHLTRVLV